MITREDASLATKILLEKAQRSIEEHHAQEFFVLFASKVSFAEGESRFLQVIVLDKLEFASIAGLMVDLFGHYQGVDC